MKCSQSSLLLIKIVSGSHCKQRSGCFKTSQPSIFCKPLPEALGCPKDLCERMIRAVAEGRSCHAAAAIFGVNVSSAIRWVNRHRTTGETQAHRRGGSKPRTLASHPDCILARVAQKPDITLRALIAELALQGVKATYYAVWYLFKREDYSFRKKPVRQRTKTPRRGAPRRPVAALSGRGRSKPSRVHR